jgi:hypothetical protein
MSIAVFLPACLPAYLLITVSACLRAAYSVPAACLSLSRLHASFLPAAPSVWFFASLLTFSKTSNEGMNVV